MSGRIYRVMVVDHERWREMLDQVEPMPGENPHDARVRYIDALGATPFQLSGIQFLWVCPGCGGVAGGTLGEQPVSGWDELRWVNSGTLERPTLTPSLGCPTWRRGLCDGHWWLRDGELVPT